MLNAIDVARYFLAMQETEETGELISNLKIQKLCYYAQGFALAILDRPLFSEQVHAWQHGPVVIPLWQEFNQYGAGAIPAPDDLDLEMYDPEDRELMDEVFSVYGQFSAWKLRNMTHNELPWVDTPANHIISHQSLKDYFETLVIEDAEETIKA